jgi:hypothetical protein
MPSGLKHLVTCRCVIQQLKRMTNPPQHQFVVFSIIDDDATVRPKFVQCNNCDIVHKVTEVNRSEIVTRESMGSLATVDDIKAGMPPQLANLLEANDADVATWEHAQFIIENEEWGSFVVLKTDAEEGLRQGKYVRIMGPTMFKVETFARAEVVK